jgi:hypothetical protein
MPYKTDYEALRKSQANRPLMLTIIDMCESQGTPIVEDCDAPPMIVMNDRKTDIFWR